MKTTEDYKRKARLEKLERLILNQFDKIVTTKVFPPYYDKWCWWLNKIRAELIEIKYK